MARFASCARGLCSAAFILAVGARVPDAAAEEACEKPADVTAVQLLNRWRAEFVTGDADRIAGLYAVNAVLIATKDGKSYEGRDAIRGYYKSLLVRRPGLSIKPAELTPGCGTVVISGPAVYRLTGERKGTRVLLGGRFTAEFALADGAWLIVRHSLAADPRSVGEAFGEGAPKTPPFERFSADSVRGAQRSDGGKSRRAPRNASRWSSSPPFFHVALPGMASGRALNSRVDAPVCDRSDPGGAINVADHEG